MVRMNKVILAGNLTRDPVLRKTPKGLAVADFGLAVSDGYSGKNGNSEESTCFVDVVAWDKQAAVCGEFLRKGRPVLLEGRLQFSQWKDKSGETRSKLKVTADRIQFMSRPEGAARAKTSQREAVEEEM
ncbi:MAG: single-stranded DNA-binding protein [Kiritimatiellae bacterium]|nr:single-stranded DNA-binding protein [Kiritimatiellia bacterium]